MMDKLNSLTALVNDIILLKKKTYLSFFLFQFVSLFTIEHQLSQLEKQLISSNSKQSKYEKQLLEIHLNLKEYEDNAKETSTRLLDVTNENKLLSAENVSHVSYTRSSLDQ